MCVDDIPPEILLHILSYLDLPDLASVAQVSPQFALLTSDTVLHTHRLRVVAPSRVKHALFGQSPEGIALRPSFPDLIHRGVMRGLHIERRWRMGSYVYTLGSIIQYESSLRLSRRHVGRVVSKHLLRRSSAPDNAPLKGLYQSNVLPDVESSSLTVSRTLLPIMHKLKWSFQKDKLAKMARKGSVCAGGFTDFSQWLENRGKGIVPDSERVRLAICPNVRKIVSIYEHLAR
ncbi:uncharacterized protein BT62DRAFT_295545 [Guyanagaster necrorhizus]|uniref:F-box domain-containing protein n=1 Tax=Guyanagaster necrorhizus TaxID=856835 RepID=A0A9P7W2R5_9AGAR|nr:uncharacterized protein BT62DRAFT_295545 [Guyanagaster necrorhizus MCA 3950]KAG7452281.1 hypothetical protein BT62DRAFT_295545 [Guyanagaster necrorhizus MCA 3950]